MYFFILKTSILFYSFSLLETQIYNKHPDNLRFILSLRWIPVFPFLSCRTTSRWACPAQSTASSSGCFWRKRETIWGNCWMQKSIWCLSQTFSQELRQMGLKVTDHPDISHTGSVRKDSALTPLCYSVRTYTVDEPVHLSQLLTCVSVSKNVLLSVFDFPSCWFLSHRAETRAWISTHPSLVVLAACTRPWAPWATASTRPYLWGPAPPTVHGPLSTRCWLVAHQPAVSLTLSSWTDLQTTPPSLQLVLDATPKTPLTLMGARVTWKQTDQCKMDSMFLIIFITHCPGGIMVIITITPCQVRPKELTLLIPIQDHPGYDTTFFFKTDFWKRWWSLKIVKTKLAKNNMKHGRKFFLLTHRNLDLTDLWTSTSD